MTTATQVAGAVRERCGIELETEGTFDATDIYATTWVILGPRPERSLSMNVAVFSDASLAEREGLLPPPGEPDAQGVWWEFFSGEGTRSGGQYWSASSVYGNVRLNWFAPSRHLDDAWACIDAALRGLTTLA